MEFQLEILLWSARSPDLSSPNMSDQLGDHIQASADLLDQESRRLQQLWADRTGYNGCMTVLF